MFQMSARRAKEKAGNLTIPAKLVTELAECELNQPKIEPPAQLMLGFYFENKLKIPAAVLSAASSFANPFIFLPRSSLASYAS